MAIYRSQRPQCECTLPVRRRPPLRMHAVKHGALTRVDQELVSKLAPGVPRDSLLRTSMRRVELRTGPP